MNVYIVTSTHDNIIDSVWATLEPAEARAWFITHDSSEEWADDAQIEVWTVGGSKVDLIQNNDWIR